MEKAILESFREPSEVREMPLGRVELVKVSGATVGRATFQPGWRGSTSLKPIVKTESCDVDVFTCTVLCVDDGSRRPGADAGGLRQAC